jgi:predicted RNA-binding Zn-ribbon protein involved in translation (DUF1610 family)
MMPEGFKTCPMCGEHWATLEDFVRDHRLVVNGYMASFDDPGTGLVFVTHTAPECGTTLSVRAAALRPLYHGPEYEELHYGAPDCRRLCLDRNRLEECEAPCRMAWVRHALQYLRRHEMPADRVEAVA